MKKIRSLLKQYWDILSYLFFGILTTIVNFLVYFPLYNWLHWPAVLCNFLAWVVAVAFAFVTNKPFVFKSNDWSLHTLVPELSKFVGCRIGSGLIETGMIWLCVDILAFNGNIIKVLVSVIVVVLNYVGSKWLVFNKNHKH